MCGNIVAEIQVRGLLVPNRQLHAERLTLDRSKRTHTANLHELPDSVFVILPGQVRTPHLVLGDALLAWAAGGYRGRIERPRGIAVEVLTPELTERAIRGGSVPGLHHSASTSLAQQ